MNNQLLKQVTAKVSAGLVFGCFVYCFFTLMLAARDWDNVFDLPDLPENTVMFDHEKIFAYRGRIGYFVLPPSKMGIYFDSKVNYQRPEEEETSEKDNDAMHKTGLDYFGGEAIADKEIWHDQESIKVIFDRKNVGLSFCGAYIMILGDLSSYGTMTFMIKGQDGGESFQIGVNDAISNKREDAVFIGSINRFLPGGITRDWQMVKINLTEFYGPDLSQIMSFVLDFNEESKGTFWIDDLRFYKDALYSPWENIYKTGYLLLDNFDYNYLNLLGRKANVYKKLPSYCKHTLDPDVFYGEQGKSLRLDFNKGGTGWTGYFTLLNQIDGEWFDLSGFDRVTFMVKGKKGGETFEIGMADKNWVTIGDSLKAGPIEKYLPNGVTQEWQEVAIKLTDFGLLDFSEMGSFVINFHKKSEGAIWIDDLKFYLKQEEEEEPEW